MKWKRPGRSFLGWLALVTVMAASPGNLHGQFEGPDEVPVQLVEEIDLFTRVMWTLQLLFVPSSIEHVNPLYAYDVEAVEGQEVRLERVGPVAMVGQCSVSSSRAETWCAQYFSEIAAAYRAAYAAADAADRDYYFATTYPLPNIRPARRFVSRQSP